MLYHAISMASKVGSLKADQLAELRSLLRFNKKVTLTLRYTSPTRGGKLSLAATFEASVSTIAEVGDRAAFLNT